MRSWNSSTESAMRPTGVAERPSSSSSCITRAVEDMARQRPSTIALLMPAPTARDAGADGERAEHELQPADAEHIAAQRPQPRHRQLQPDQEQQEHHAELGQDLDPVAILDGEIAQPGKVAGEPPEAVGAHQDPDEKEPEHRCRCARDGTAER